MSIYFPNKLVRCIKNLTLVVYQLKTMSSLKTSAAVKLQAGIIKNKTSMSPYLTHGKHMNTLMLGSNKQTYTRTYLFDQK